jgi:Uma2 family endonuclease
MAALTTNYPVILDPQAYAGIHLVEDDGEPMETFAHRGNMDQLIDVVTYHCRARSDFFVGGNNFIYFNPDQARNRDYRGPDFFYIKDGVDRARERQCWAVWEENGRLPDVVIELLSETTEEVDRTTKYAIYEQSWRMPEYFLYDPLTFQLEGFRLVDGVYQPLELDERGWMWSEELGLWLGLWQGKFRESQWTWLRLYTSDGKIAPRYDEAAIQFAEEQRRQVDEQRRQVDEQRRRADAAEQELARLRALLAGQEHPPSAKNGSPQ